jgi:hypothetical protein
LAYDYAEVEVLLASRREIKSHGKKATLPIVAWEHNMSSELDTMYKLPEEFPIPRCAPFRGVVPIVPQLARPPEPDYSAGIRMMI